MIANAKLQHWIGWPWLAVLALALASYVQHATVLGAGGEQVWYISADSWKNVYAVVYHALYDGSFWHTDALGWPYGEHIAMADGQPLLSGLLQPLAQAGWVGEQGLTYLVLLLPIVSIPALGVLQYTLLRTWGLSRVWAAAWAIPITMLYPQLARVQGHYALAYGWVLPGLLLLWMRARRSGYGLASALVVGVGVLAVSLLHPYYLGLSGLMLGSLVVFDALVTRRLLIGRRIGWLVLAVLVPAMMTVASNRLSDYATDRVAEPYGLSAYTSKPLALVTSREQPHWRWFHEYVSQLRAVEPERRSYLGLLIALGVIVVGIASVRQREMNLGGAVVPVAQRTLIATVLLAGLAATVFSWGFPMGLKGEVGDAVRSVAGPLRQLRSLGRFSWIAYYLWAPLGVLGLSLWAARVRWGWVGLLAALAFTTFEGVAYWQHYAFDGMRNRLLPERARIRTATQDIDAVAIIPVPFYHVGSENFSIDDSHFSLYYSTSPALALGIPSAGLYMSRTSYADALATVEVGFGGWQLPKVLEDRYLDSTFLVSVSKTYVQEVAAQADSAFAKTTPLDAILDTSTQVYENEWMTLRAMVPRAYQTALAGAAARYERLALGSTPDTLGSLVVNDSTRWRSTLVEHFDAHSNALGLLGSAGFNVTDAALTEVARFDVDDNLRDREVAVSFWVHVPQEGQLQSSFRIRFPGSAEAPHEPYHGLLRNHWTEVHAGWARIEAVVRVPKETEHVVLDLSNSRTDQGGGVIVDEVLLRPADIHVSYPIGQYQLTDGRLWVGPTSM